MPSPRPTTVPKPRRWRCLATSTTIDHRYLHVEARTYRDAHGRTIEPYWVIRERGWTIVVPVLPDGRMVMVEQFRPASDRVLLEFPAGDLDPDETPAVCAARELREETGVRVPPSALIPLGALRPEPARSTAVAHGFAVRLTRMPDIGRRRGVGTEDLRLRVVTPGQLSRALERGDFCHGTQLAYLHQAARIGLVTWA